MKLVRKVEKSNLLNRPKEGEQLRQGEEGPVPILAPPPKSPQNSAYSDATLRFNPFDKSAGFAQEAYAPSNIEQAEIKRTDSQVGFQLSKI